MKIYICEECGKLCKNIRGLPQHINCFHNIKNYYDKWLKEEGEEICKVCGNNTDFKNFSSGYFK